MDRKGWTRTSSPPSLAADQNPISLSCHDNLILPKDYLIVKIQGMGAPDNKQNRYPVPQATMTLPWRTELTIRKSLFITRAFRCESAAMVKDFIAGLRQKEPDASHHCWAFAAGPPGDTALIGCSDDGEPHGTAGKPMLNMLLHGGVGQVCMVTSRWFGGIKLGTGGLARAYQDSVRTNLENMPLVELVAKESWTLLTNYQCLDAIKRCLPEFEAEISGEKYLEKVELSLNVPMEMAESLASSLSRLSNGAALFYKNEPSQEG